MTPDDLGREKLKLWKEKPVAYVEQNFGVTPDAWQHDVLEAFPHHQRIGMKACKGPGKTAVEAWCAWNFLTTRPYPKVACTSITRDNLRDNLWAEMAKWRSKSNFLKDAFEWTQNRIFLRGCEETWFAVARSWPKSADKDKQAETLAGLHADYILFVLDEVSGIPNAVMTTAEAALASGIECKLLIGGNPTDPTGPLGLACGRDKALWFIVTVTGDPDDPKRSPRVRLQWAKDEIKKHGRDNPWVMVNVLGLFPPAAINALLGMEDVEKAQARKLKRQDYEWGQKRLGVDVARFGDDRSVIFARQGLRAFMPIEMRNWNTIQIAARVAEAQSAWGSEVTFVDDTGHWGHGVLDMLITAGHSPIPLQYHATALNPRYENRRAEFWFKGADWVKGGGQLPKECPSLVGELITPTYTFTLQGKLIIEPKEMVKARLGRSPDLADALFQTFAHPEMPGGLAEELGRAGVEVPEAYEALLHEEGRKAVVDWDPYK